MADVVRALNWPLDALQAALCLGLLCTFIISLHSINRFYFDKFETWLHVARTGDDVGDVLLESALIRYKSFLFFLFFFFLLFLFRFVVSVLQPNTCLSRRRRLSDQSTLLRRLISWSILLWGCRWRSRLPRILRAISEHVTFRSLR